MRERSEDRARAVASDVLRDHGRHLEVGRRPIVDDAAVLLRVAGVELLEAVGAAAAEAAVVLRIADLVT